MSHNFKINEDDAVMQMRRPKAPGGIIGLVIKTGLVKTPAQANILLMAFVAVGIIAIILLNISTYS